MLPDRPTHKNAPPNYGRENGGTYDYCRQKDQADYCAYGDQAGEYAKSARADSSCAYPASSGAAARKGVIHMADKQVFDVVNRNHQRQAILDRIVIDLDIIDLRANLNSISARRRNRNVPKMPMLRRKLRPL